MPLTEKNTFKTKNPVNIHYDEPIAMLMLDSLDAIKVDLKYATPFEDLLNILPDAARSSWLETPDGYKDASEFDRLLELRRIFKGKTIPALKRYINLIWTFDGINMQVVTHLLRYQDWNFIAQCSDVANWRKRIATCPQAIASIPELYDRWKKNTVDAMQLYADAVDTRKIDILSARQIFPRNLTTFYWAHNNLQSCERFILDRSSIEYQPPEDNIVAFQMALAILKKYPVANGLFNIDKIAPYYKDLLETHNRTYRPREKADTFDYGPDDFAYDKTRDEYIGDDEVSLFLQKKQWYMDEIKKQEEINNQYLKEKFGYTNEELDNYA